MVLAASLSLLRRNSFRMPSGPSSLRIVDDPPLSYPSEAIAVSRITFPYLHTLQQSIRTRLPYHDSGQCMFTGYSRCCHLIMSWSAQPSRSVAADAFLLWPFRPKASHSLQRLRDVHDFAISNHLIVQRVFQTSLIWNFHSSTYII
jgi:hypothetical protein